MRFSTTRGERGMAVLFGAAGWLSAAVTLLIFIFLCGQAAPALREIPLRDWFGPVWAPSQGLWGILPMLAGSFGVTAVALAIGAPLGILTALFLTHFCPRGLAPVLGAAADLLAGIPSVVYGFFGLELLVPAVRVLFGGSGMSVLTAGLLLGVMILPTVLSLARQALLAVDGALLRGARALGLSHAGAVFGVVLPAARGGVRQAILLGLGRAVGETMAVVMVAGNQPRLSGNLLDGARTLSTGIVIEMGYATGAHRAALILLALILFAVILLLNLLLARRSARAPRARAFCGGGGGLRALVWGAGGLTLTVLGAILVFVTVRGAPYVADALPGLLAPAVSTLGILALALAAALPVGVGAAVYLSEYVRTGRAAALARMAVQTLTGLPSVVWGLFGMLLLVMQWGWGYSLAAGGLTLGLMVLPLIVRTTEEALASVDVSLRRGSAALGAGRLFTLRRILLPGAARGIVAGVLLAVGRMLGETAALLYTAGSVAQMPRSLFSSGRTLAVHMYALAGEGLYTNEAYATAFVLLLLVAALHLTAVLFGRGRTGRERA